MEGDTWHVLSVAVTPDGSRIVSGGWTGLVRIWDVYSGEQLAELVSPDGVVCAVEVTHDGSRIITGGGWSVRIWDANSGEQLAQLTGHEAPVEAVAVTPDGTSIIAGTASSLVMWRLYGAAAQPCGPAMKATASDHGPNATSREAPTLLPTALEMAADAAVLRLENRTWQLGKPLGSGGFAEVFEAISGDQVAVAKLIPKQPGAHRELLFENLAGARNVVPILDRGEYDDNWVIVMPRANRSLRENLREGALPLAQALIVMRDVAQALKDIHDHAVHRDIKPDNILLLNGRWCLADFGIARYAEASTAPDTRKFSLSPPYAAPEQWLFQHATSAADVYALGITIYEALSGERPFPGPGHERYRDQHLHTVPPPLAGSPPTLASVLSECLYKAPEARPTPTQILARLATVPAVPGSPGLAALQAANVTEIQRLASKDGTRARNLSEENRRAALLDAATQSFNDILTQLAEAVHKASSAARITLSRQGLRIVLGVGSLVVDSFHAPSGDWSGYPFEVIATATISVIQPANRNGFTGRSHSLWFADAQRERQYHWFETAFMVNPFMSAGMRPHYPFALAADADARMALSPGIGTYQVAWPFTPLAPGYLGGWISEWSMRLAAASTGGLEVPRQVPERDPAGSWRRS
jgi:serine/threonine-protein kinase